jgi:hypothetical protein
MHSYQHSIAFKFVSSLTVFFIKTIPQYFYVDKGKIYKLLELV